MASYRWFSKQAWDRLWTAIKWSWCIYLPPTAAILDRNNMICNIPSGVILTPNRTHGGLVIVDFLRSFLVGFYSHGCRCMIGSKLEKLKAAQHELETLRSQCLELRKKAKRLEHPDHVFVEYMDPWIRMRKDCEAHWLNMIEITFCKICQVEPIHRYRPYI